MHDPEPAAAQSDILKIVLIYAVFAGLWILFSDEAVTWFFSDSTSVHVANTLKGWFFVAITSALLYLLLNRLVSHRIGHSESIPRSGFVNWKTWQLYLFAAATTLFTLMLRQHMAGMFGDRPLMILFMFPIILSAALGGFGPGLLSTLLSALFLSYFVLPPLGSFGLNNPHDQLQLGFLSANGLLVSFLSKMLHETRYQSEVERQLAETSLREKTRLLQLLDAIAEGSSDAIYVKDVMGRYLLINHAAARFVGKSIEEILGKDDTAIFPPEDAEAIMALDLRVMDEDRIVSSEETMSTVSGKTVFSSKTGPFHDDLGNVIGIFGIWRDVTDNRKAVQALRESEAMYRSLFEHLLNGFAYCRMLYVDGKPDDFIYLGVNHAFETHTGLKDVVGRKVSEIIPGIREADPGLFEIYSRVALGDEPEQFETYVNALDMWFAISVYSPKPEHFVAVFDVITERKNAEKALRKSKELLQSVVENVPVRVFWKDRESRYLGCNNHFAKDAGYQNRDELTGKTDFEMGWRKQAELYRADDKVVMDSGIPKLDFEEPSTTPDGNTIWIRTSKVPLRDENGQIIGILGVYEDITHRKLAEEQLRKLSLAVEQSPESIAITDLDGNIEYVNEAFVRISGYSREEIIGQNPRILQSGRTPHSTYEDFWHHLNEGITWNGEFYNKRKDGNEYIEHATVSPIRQPDGRITHYVAVKEDITEKKRAEAEINRLAFYDTLTGLPNRALLLERTSQAVSTLRRLGEHSALISFNINRFKTINDAGGQALGDALLKAVGERLSKLMHEGDVVARIAGDEFAILLSNLAPEQQTAALLALHVADKIHTWLLEPFHIGDEPITLTATLGIALFPAKDDDSSLDILRRSNTALHHAKTGGAGQTAFFEETLDEIAKQRFNIERELHRAIANSELRIFLQPQVEATGEIVGAEALVRWQHPQRGLIAPSIFIPIAEESNLIVEIDLWVFNEVCRLLVHEDICTRPIRISVNISPRHFRQPNFVDQIKAGLAGTGADPARLTLEITEGMVIDNINDVIAKMNALSTMGIHFSMDDFGTGYSSLSYLKRLPIDELKIDKSFIQDLTVDPEDDALVETILAVAKLMHVKVVAEGVETAEQAAFLNQRGHVIHQGYLFGRPEHAETVIANIAKNGL